jgi:hypothetical protein
MNRIEKARSIVNAGLVGVLQRDNEGRPQVLRVPGSEGKSYQVIIRRKDFLSCECSMETGNLGYTPCEGNKKTVCYHSIAALLASAGERIVVVCTDRVTAKKVSNLGGKVHEVKSWNGGRPIWIVVKKGE